MGRVLDNDDVLALAVDVATTTLGLIIIGMKRVWPLGQHVRQGGWRESPYWPSREIRHKIVGIVGASHVGRRLIELLRPLEVKILLYDPFVSEDDIGELQVEKTDLEELLRRSDVVSLHAPAKPDHVIGCAAASLAKTEIGPHHHMRQTQAFANDIARHH